MTKIVKMVGVGLLLTVLPVARISAQTNSYRTNVNVLINLSFSLTAYEQAYVILSTGFGTPTARTVSVATGGIIKSIRDSAHLTNNVDNAKLYWRHSWSGSNDPSDDVILRNPGGFIMGTNDFVVNNYLNVTFPDKVTTLRATLTGTLNSTDYANCSATLGTSQGSFALHGLATIKSGSVFNGKTLIDPSPAPISFTVAVAGSGSIAFHQAEWKGTIIGSGQKVEVTRVPQ